VKRNSDGPLRASFIFHLLKAGYEDYRGGFL
jgi:hypothetical protein